MKKLLYRLLIAAAVSFSIPFAILMLYGATAGEAVLFIATAGYTVTGTELPGALTAVCVVGALVASLCIQVALLCAAVYGLAWVARRGWDGAETPERGAP